MANPSETFEGAASETTAAFSSPAPVSLQAEWRPVLETVVASFNAESVEKSLNDIGNVKFDRENLAVSAYQIAEYPASQVYISDESWNSSQALREKNGWSCLLDLAADAEAVTDLVLPFKAQPVDNRTEFEIGFIHVP